MRKLTKDELQALRRLAAGDAIFFSQDGDDAWFSKGDRDFVSRNVVVGLRTKGLTVRCCDDDENYRGMSEYDAISEAGRKALEAKNG